MPSGIIVPIITPFNRDGSIAWPAYERVVAHVIDGGVDAIFVHPFLRALRVLRGYKKQVRIRVNSCNPWSKKLPRHPTKTATNHFL
jgi:hypothetical protein